MHAWYDMLIISLAVHVVWFLGQCGTVQDRRWRYHRYGSVGLQRYGELPSEWMIVRELSKTPLMTSGGERGERKGKRKEWY